MKASELMIGDIVRVAKDVCIPKGTIVSIKGIDADNRFIEKHLVGSATCLPINDEDRMTGGVWVEYLEPIPITPEILEKNGFEKEWDEDIMLMVCDTIIVEIGDNYKLYKDGKMYFRRVLAPLYYVHQLQHALRLCGIEKTIEL